MFSKKIMAGMAITLGVLAGTAGLVHAEETTRPKQELREDIKENRMEIKEERKDEVSEMVAERHANRLERRFKFYEQRLTNLANRLEKRLATMKAEGKNVTDAEAKLATARTNITTAVKAGEEAVAAFRAIDSAEGRKEAVVAAKTKAEAAREAFKTAHKSLQAVIPLAEAAK